MIDNPIFRGILAGLGATVTMSAEMAAGQALGLMQTAPPKQITGSAGRKAGGSPRDDKSGFTISWVAAHGGFGVAGGVIYSLARPMLPGGTVISGLIYGAVVWVTSYAGFLPRLGLYPWPAQDSNSRKAVMLAAHAVYGLTLAELDQRLT